MARWVLDIDDESFVVETSEPGETPRLFFSLRGADGKPTDAIDVSVMDAQRVRLTIASAIGVVTGGSTS